jgi:hypothetical protein
MRCAPSECGISSLGKRDRKNITETPYPRQQRAFCAKAHPVFSSHTLLTGKDPADENDGEEMTPGRKSPGKSMNYIAGRLAEIKKRYGPESVF